MHPGLYYWWKSRHGGAAEGDCAYEGMGWGPRGWQRGHGFSGYEAAGDSEGSAFGVRRPLRFLAHKLDLNESQVGELARILSELKTERAQADVDGRRTVSAFADAVAGPSFDETKAKAGAALRVESAERLREAVTRALSRIHALLDDEQRSRLAYLIRTGVVSL